jgi:hypothetical protein
MTRKAHLGTAVTAAMLAATMATAQGQAGRGQPAAPALAATPAPLDERTKAAILEGLADERKTEAAYAAVIARHGEVRPFTNAVRAEDRHAAFLEKLLTSRGIAVPEAKAAAVAAPATLREACQAALESERANVALYDRLLAGATPDDVKSAFEHNRWASLERHVPAFERCVARGDGGVAVRHGGRGRGWSGCARHAGCGRANGCGHGCGPDSGQGCRGNAGGGSNGCCRGRGDAATAATAPGARAR